MIYCIFSSSKGIGREESSIDLEEEEEMMAEVATVGLEDSALQEAGFRTEEVRVLYPIKHLIIWHIFTRP
jgi:hypothetical protein